MMEKIPCSVSVIRYNSERQENLKDSERIYSKSYGRKEKSSCHCETEVMVECVSSTTEQSLPTTHRKPPSPVSKCASLDKIPMSQEQKNREKHMDREKQMDDNSDACMLKPVTSGCSTQSVKRDTDKNSKRQYQEVLSASTKDRTSHCHSSMMKRIPRREKPIDEPDMCSSSLVLQSRASSFSCAGSYARKSSYSNSKRGRDPKFRSEREKYAHSSRDLSTSRNLVFRENNSRNGEVGRREESYEKNRNISTSSKNRKPNSYKKMVENKIREIKNNIEKMSSKEMVEQRVKEIRGNLEKMGNDVPRSLVESQETVRVSASEQTEGCDEQSKEEENQLVPFLPSSRCCSPPPRPAIVEKYWSDGDETEYESDIEKHLLHVSSVNIVLNHLKNNSEKYFVDGNKISNQIKGYKHTDSRKHSRKRQSFQSDSKSHSTWAKSGHSKGLCRGYSRGENLSQPPIDPYGLGLLISMRLAKSRDSQSGSPSKDVNLLDRKSLHSSGHDSHCYRSVHSSSSSSKGSPSPTWREDNKYRQSLSHKHRKGFQSDRGSRSPSTHRRGKASCSPHRYRGSCMPPRHLKYRGSRSPSRHTRSRSPSTHTSRSSSTHSESHSPSRHRESCSPPRHTRHIELQYHNATLREQHSSPEVSLSNKTLARDKETQLKEGGSSKSRTANASSASSQHLIPSHSDRQTSFHNRFNYSLESLGPSSNERTVETLVTREIRQESGFERSTSIKNISQRWQQVKHENEMKLPLAFGKGVQKTLRIDEVFNWSKDSLSVVTINEKRRKDQTTSKVNRFETDNDNDDDEPMIEEPEDYLSASNTMTMYRPSFVPDTHDREKLASSGRGNISSQSHENLSVDEPSGVTSLPTPSEKEQDDSLHKMSGSECDQVIEDEDSAVPHVSSSSASLDPGPSGVTTSMKSDDIFDLSVVLKEVSAEVAKTEEKALLNLNSAEMKTLLSLIKLAKDHVATGKDLPSNFSQVLENGGGVSNSKAVEPQSNQQQQQQPGISQVSADMENKVENENVRALSEILTEKKESDDHLLQSKADDKHALSRDDVQGSKIDGKLLKVRKSDQQSSEENVDKTVLGKNKQQSSGENVDKTVLEKNKRKGQSPKKFGKLKDVSSSINKSQQDKNRQFSKSGTGNSVIKKAFKQMQSVKVNLSGSQDIINSYIRAKHHQGITNLEDSNRQLKRVGKRIFMDNSSDSEDDSLSTKPKKDESPVAGKQPLKMHPCYHSVSMCHACKCNLKLDQFTTVSLNTGTVTLRCRNCHTYRKMEKVLSLQCYTSTGKTKDFSLEKSNASGVSVAYNNGEYNRKVNVTPSSQHSKNKDTRKEGESLLRINSSKEAREKKEDSQQDANSKKKREKTYIPSAKRKHEDDKTTVHSYKFTKVVKCTTATKTDAVKISISADSASEY